MLHDIWALMTEPIIISLTFFILWILTIQKKRKVEYHLAGRLANQHTIDNLLVNSMSISDQARQVSYLEFVAKFVKYGFTCQDKSTISLALEIDQVIGIIKGHEISNECSVDYHIEINPEDMSLPVIPFLVITVVENALYYGDLDKPGKKLNISLSRLENNLYCLEFSGYTMPEKNNISKPGKGHGLYILKERLKFMHYDKSTNTVKGNKYMSLSPNGLSLKMILPI